ncbi:MAG: phage tail tape measure protein [Pseudomonadota bacterium]
MADLEKTVSILFKGVDEISGTMNSISGSLSSFGSSLDSATQPLANLALAVEKVDAAIAILAVGGMIVATTAAGKFQSGMSEIHTLLRESPEVVAAFDRSIEDYARNSTQSLEDIQKAIYQALSANVSYGESIAFVTDAEMLAVAGKSTLTEAVDLLTSTLTAYGAGWNEASNYSDIFLKTVEIGKITIPELSQSLALVAPIAATAGISIEEVGAAMAAMTAGGLTAGPSAEYLRHAITDLIDPAAAARGAFADLGIAYGGAELSAHGLSGKMAEIWEKSNGNIDVIAKLFGNVTSMTAAMVLGKDSSGYYAKALEELANAAGATDRAYGIMVNNFELVNTRLINSMKLALIDAGIPLLEDWNLLAVGIGNVFKGIDIGLKAGAFDEVYKDIESFSKQFTEYLNGVAKAVPEAMALIDFGPLLSSLKELGTAVGADLESLFGKFDLTKPEGLAAAIQKVVDAGTKLSEFSTGIAEGLKPFATEMGELINKALAADTEVTKLAGTTAGFGQGVNTVVKALGFVGPALAILSGSLVVEAVATVGKLGIALVALPAAPVVAVGAALLALGYAANSMNPDIDLATAKFDEFGNLIGDFNNMAPETVRCIGDISRQMNDLPEVKTFTIDSETGAATEKLKTLSGDIMSFPPGFEVEAKINYDETTFGAISAKMNDIPKEYVITYKAGMDTASETLLTSLKDIPELKKLMIETEIKNEGAISAFMSELTQPDSKEISIDMNNLSFEKFDHVMQEITNPDGSTTFINVGVDAASMARTQEALKEIPTEKMMEIKLQGDINKELEAIKADAATVQAAMEWTAKVDIANAEVDARRMASAFEAASSEIGSISSSLGSLFSKDWGDFGLSQYMSAQETARKQLKMLQEVHDMNIKLLESQVKYENSKTDRMKSNKSLIKIDSTGLEPSLEMIMWQIIQKVQIKASEESASFLLGIR